jgi:uncharacterized protein YdiU (UPF0061 family)
MPVSPQYRPDPQFVKLGGEFADPVEPARFPQTMIRFRNDRAAATVGLDTLTNEEWIAHFARFEPLPGNQPQPLAMRYHGHQFRSYNPELGDGRGFLFAQLRESRRDRLLDLGTKGSGRTPYSRGGDGRLTLKGGVREILAAEMLEALGAPTSRAFSLIETGEALVRGDEPSPTRSAVLTRLSWSHIRFGTFQRHAFADRPDLIAQLVEHVLADYYPDLRPGDESPAVALLRAVCGRTAELCAAWMTAGFVHGVLNTDNMNVTGESFDYGPWRFLPHNDPTFTAAYFDQTGLYAFGRQPQAVFWNLSQLAGCLTLIEAQDPLVEVLNGFGDAYQAALRSATLRRLGLKPRDEASDLELVSAAYRLLEAGGESLGWEPFFFDWFCGDAGRAMGGVRGSLYSTEEGQAFAGLVRAYQADRPERLNHPRLAEPEPEQMLYDEVEAIWAPIAASDDWSSLTAKIARIRTYGEALGLARPSS